MIGIGLGVSKLKKRGGEVVPPVTYFGVLVDTEESGVSNNDQFQLTGAIGDYDIEAYQNEALVASFNDLSGQQTITLPAPGVYEIRVEPKAVNGFNRIRFDNGGDKNKLLEIKSWGSNVVWSNFSAAFQGCSNLGESNIVDVPNLQNVSNFFRMFRDASSFNSDLSNWNVSNGISFREMFRDASSFTSDLSQWDVSNGTNFASMFRGANLNTPGTTTNYDNLLNGWSQLNLNMNLGFHAGDSQYSTVGEVGRNKIINDFNWTIFDGGEFIAFDPDYEAVLNYGTAEGYTLPSSQQQVKQNDMVVAMKGSGIWQKLDSLSVMATDGDLDFALIDWKRLITLTAVNSPAFNMNQGFQGDGSSAYIRLHYTPATDAVNYQVNQASYGYYSFDTPVNGVRIGAIGTNSSYRAYDFATNIFNVNDSPNSITAEPFSQGMLHFNRNGGNSGDEGCYNNGLLLPTSTGRNSTNMPSVECYLLARNNNGAANFSDNTIGMQFWGDDLSVEAADFNTIIQNYMNSI